MTAYSDFSVTQGGNVSAGNQNQNMINIRHVINGTDATAAPADSLTTLRTAIDAINALENINLYDNAIINPIDANPVDQDGKSGTTVANDEYAIDGHQVVEDQTNNPTFTKGVDYIELQANATQTSPGKIAFRQKVEDDNYLKLRGETLNFSLKMVSDNANARIIIYDGISYSNSSVIVTADGSTQNTMTVSHAVSASATELTVYYGIIGDDNGTVTISASDFFRVKNLKLEKGSSATAYQPRDYEEELALCQRQFLKKTIADEDVIGPAQQRTTTAAEGFISTPVTMNKTPTLTVVSGSIGLRTNGSSVAYSTPSCTGVQPNGVELTGTTTSLTAFHAGTLIASGTTVIELDARP